MITLFIKMYSEAFALVGCLWCRLLVGYQHSRTAIQSLNISNQLPTYTA